MSVEEAGVVDFISTRGDRVVLTITDHLDWADEAGHVLALQEKINAYLAFLEGGEMSTAYPQGVGKSAVISVVMQVAPTPGCNKFFDMVRPVLEDAGFGLEVRVLGQDSPA
jgi:hypothetical protein